MIPLKNAIKITLDRHFEIKSEEVEIANSLGRVLTDDICSRISLPPFDKASMDGFAYIKSDICDKYEIIETIPAGHMPTKIVKPGQCSKIMTGAMMPEGADFIIRVEFTREENDYMIPTQGEFKNNIAKFAENLSAGDTVLQKGSIIGAKEIAVLANIGVGRVLVAKMPIVGVINTGDEIVEPGDKPEDGQIFNGNGSSLIALLNQMRIPNIYYGIIPDDENLTDIALKKALEECDIVILSGGLSMGEFDFVPQIMKQNSVEILFDRVAIKPGKPTTFGTTTSSKFVFGIPGNPVSTFVIFEIIAKQFIYKMIGHEFKPRYSYLKLTKDVKRKMAVREEYIPVKVIEDTCAPLKYHGSAHINALADADGLLRLEVDQFEVSAGEILKIRQIS